MWERDVISVQITVRLFASIAELFGTRELQLEVAEGTTAGDVLRELIRREPKIEPLASAVRLAVNHSYVSKEMQLKEGDEIALIPPVSGGAHGPLGEPDPVMGKRFEVVAHPLSPEKVAAKVTNPHIGAVALFVGVVREFTHGRRTVRLEYEAYIKMAEELLAQIGVEAATRWPGAELAISHRVGVLEIGEASVVIAAAAPHRDDAFAAARFAIEEIKRAVPIWKKEVWDDGSEWVGSQLGPAPKSLP